jgi:hypothetical protein
MTSKLSKTALVASNGPPESRRVSADVCPLAHGVVVSRPRDLYGFRRQQRSLKALEALQLS